jgi:hypothetical protein
MLNFAFGMNLDPSTMEWCRAVEVGPAKLRDWKLVFRHGLANVEPSPGDVVHGALWELDDAGQADIDRREGYVEGRAHNHYNCVLVPVDNGDERVQAFMYTMARPALEQPPGWNYLKLLLNGYKHFGLPLKALLAAVESCPEDPWGDKTFLLAQLEQKEEQHA